MEDTFVKEVKRIAQRISFGAEVTDEDPILVAAAKVLVYPPIETERPTKVYVGPHIPGYGLNSSVIPIE